MTVVILSFISFVGCYAVKPWISEDQNFPSTCTCVKKNLSATEKFRSFAVPLQTVVIVCLCETYSVTIEKIADLRCQREDSGHSIWKSDRNIKTGWRNGIIRSFIRIIVCNIILICWSQWPRDLSRRSVAARLLRLWVRIPPAAWMSVSCECCVLSCRGLGDDLITRPEKSYRLRCVVVCDLETSLMRKL